MSEEINKWWKSIAPSLRRHMGLDIPTIEESEKALIRADKEPLTEEQIDSIINFAKTGKRK